MIDDRLSLFCNGGCDGGLRLLIGAEIPAGKAFLLS